MYVQDDSGDELTNYIGHWYEGQTNPQRLFLQINPEGSATIDYNPQTDNSVPEAVWHSRILRLSLPSYVYSIEEIEEILGVFKNDIQQIQNSYEEKWNGQNHKGYFNQKLVESLEEELLKFTTRYDFYRSEKEANPMMPD